MDLSRWAALAGACLTLVAGGASAQLLDKKAISLAEAKKIVAAAEEEAKRNNLTMCIAVVDEDGQLIYFEKMDETQAASVKIAIAKARSAATFKRPTKVFEDALVGGRQAILGLTGAMPVEGGVPLTAGGKVIGAIGASGGTAQQDGQVATAGAATLK
jgi:glc operon protein GlcG